MRTVLSVLLCLPLLVPPGVCACGARPMTQSAPKCGCCHKPARTKAPTATVGQPRPDRDHALACPAHPTADVRLAKHQVAAVTFDLPGSSLYAVLPKSNEASPAPAAVSDSHADPPLYLLVCAIRC